jgi:hypothetical protein
MNPTRRAACARLLALVAAPLAAASLLSSCAGLVGPREVNLPLERLQRNLDKRFPIHQRAAGVFDIQFSAPQVTTLRENDRIALSVDVAVFTHADAAVVARQPGHLRPPGSGYRAQRGLPQ